MLLQLVEGRQPRAHGRVRAVPGPGDFLQLLLVIVILDGVQGPSRAHLVASADPPAALLFLFVVAVALATSLFVGFARHDDGAHRICTVV